MGKESKTVNLSSADFQGEDSTFLVKNLFIYSNASNVKI